MSIQEIENYKLKWLKSKCFRVRIDSTDGEHILWLEENIDRKDWDYSVNVQNSRHTFFFKNSPDADKFREAFKGESRLVDFA